MSHTTDPMYDAMPPGGYVIDEGDPEWREYDMARCAACGCTGAKEDFARTDDGLWLCNACYNALTDIREICK